ncbi:MAG: hypothetical protein D6737_03450 [Chloroflexi bacterium]|nr:MAG: hypothetical protein CUN54_04195 [Phototrophicales bacterium]RMF81938.1 MAG: hypothetical protein D6737_03450 [Chloroflexota bacterium]
MTTLKHIHQQSSWIILLLILGACSSQTPIPIFVTATPDPPQTPSSTPIVVAQAASPEADLGILTDDADDNTQATPTRSTFLGPVVGPNYTPPPSFTPRPTATGQPTDTATPGPSPTPQPRATRVGPQPTVLPNLDGSQLGIQVHSLIEQDTWREMMRRVEQLHIGWVKVQVDWRLIQPNGPNDVGEDFRRLELFLEDANQRGLKVLISVAKAPDWARSVHEEAGPPDNPQDLANFVNLMLLEFGEIINAIEVWNEPNLLREWRGPNPPSGSDYMRYFRAVYETTRAYSPSITVITAGLAPTGNNAPFSVDDRDYLQQMYNAGLAQFTDIAVGVHPFSWGNPPDVRCCNAVEGQGWDDDPHFFFSHTVEDYRNIMNANGHGGVQMWFTEFGWATWDEFPGEAPEVWMTYTDKWAQGNNTLRAIQIGQSRSDIGTMILWNLNFGILPGLIENRDERAAYSLLTPLNPLERPLFWMLFDATQADVQLDRYD